jgi:hypothetical protein
VMVPVLTTEEALFNRAEAYVMKNRIDDAIADLNAYASTRIFNYNPSTHAVTRNKMQYFYGTGNAQLATLNTVLDFKRAEFVQEGMRWFDLLRYQQPVEHRDWHGWRSTLTANDPRRVFQIPDVAKMAGIEQNPR